MRIRELGSSSVQALHITGTDGRYVTAMSEEPRVYVAAELFDPSTAPTVTRIILEGARVSASNDRVGWPVDWLVYAARRLFEERKAQMGTSVVACAVLDECVVFAQCGLGAAWRIQNGQPAEKTSFDHSIAMHELQHSGDLGKYTSLCEAGFDWAPSTALGLTEDTRVDIRVMPRRLGEGIVLMSGTKGAVKSVERRFADVRSVEGARSELEGVGKSSPCAAVLVQFGDAAIK